MPCCGPEHLDWLAGLPTVAEHEDIVLFHANPHDDADMLLEAMDPAGTCPRSVAEVEPRVAGIDAPLILCGHSHVPRLVELPGGRRVLNPGSVGLQGFREAGPPAWAVGTGSPHARYALLHRDDGRWRVEPRVRGLPVGRRGGGGGGGRAHGLGAAARDGLAVKARAPAAPRLPDVLEPAAGVALEDDARLAGERLDGPRGARADRARPRFRAGADDAAARSTARGSRASALRDCELERCSLAGALALDAVDDPRARSTPAG